MIKMIYLEVVWSHSIISEPVKLYSEIDEQLWERRKVEVYADGTAGYADAAHSTRGTKLSIEPLPSIEEIAADPQFTPREITAEDFEAVWQRFTAERNDATEGEH
jgi:hypothetical protein